MSQSKADLTDALKKGGAAHSQNHSVGFLTGSCLGIFVVVALCVSKAMLLSRSRLTAWFNTEQLI